MDILPFVVDVDDFSTFGHQRLLLLHTLELITCPIKIS